MSSQPTNSTVTLTIREQTELFLYTPYGLATLAATAILLTSCVWLLGCCLYCCHRRRMRAQERGTSEAGRELFYLGVNENNNGTLTSAYNNVPPNYSLATTDPTFHTSLDSILQDNP